MSALGQRLTGAAADVFGALDAKARGTLDGIVSSGKMSADDVVKGLTAIAKNAAADAFVVNGLEKNSQQGGFSAAIVAAGAVSDGAAGQRRSLTAAHGSGAMSADDYATQMTALTDTVTKRQDELLSPFAGTAGKPIVIETGGKPLELPSDGEQAALEKLAQLGFDKPVYRDGASAYGAQFRTSPDGAAPAPAGEGGAAASVQTASATTVSVTSTSTTTSTAAPSSSTAAPSSSTAAPSAGPASALDSRVAAGKAAASMLQAALDGGAKPASSLFSSGASAAGAAGSGGDAASSLLDALKGGAAKTGNSTGGEG